MPQDTMIDRAAQALTKGLQAHPWFQSAERLDEQTIQMFVRGVTDRSRPSNFCFRNFRVVVEVVYE